MAPPGDIYKQQVEAEGRITNNTSEYGLSTNQQVDIILGCIHPGKTVLCHYTTQRQRSGIPVLFSFLEEKIIE